MEEGGKGGESPGVLDLSLARRRKQGVIYDFLSQHFIMVIKAHGTLKMLHKRNNNSVMGNYLIEVRFVRYPNSVYPGIYGP